MKRRIERHSQRLGMKYNTNYDLVAELLEMVGKEDTIEILEMTPNDLRPTARVNLMKFSRKEIISHLAWENIIAKPIPEIAEGIEIVDGGRKLGSSQSYLNGEVMPQGLGSMLTVKTLDPKPGEIVVDLAAAPGGKSCFIGEKLMGEGYLISNDISVSRFRSLIFNLARHDIQNVYLSNRDGKKLEVDYVNKILLDAPCTGGGLLVSKPQRRVTKSTSDSVQLQRLQIQLLQHALSLLDPGGICVYATCAVSPLENEMVIERFQNDVEFKMLDIEGSDAFLETKVVGKRLYPHLHKCDGFFIVKMEKIE